MTRFCGRGCANCFQTGYTDRTGIYEILPMDDAVKLQVMERASATPRSPPISTSSFMFFDLSSLMFMGCVGVLDGWGETGR